MRRWESDDATQVAGQDSSPAADVHIGLFVPAKSSKVVTSWIQAATAEGKIWKSRRLIGAANSEPARAANTRFGTNARPLSSACRARRLGLSRWLSIKLSAMAKE